MKKLVTTENVINTVSKWKGVKDRTKKITLPSGVEIEIKEKIGILEWASSGYIPLDLLNSVFETGQKLAGGKGFGETTEKELSDMMDVLRKIACLIVVSPVVSFEPKENEMNVKDILEDDLFAIFGEALMRGGEQSNLKPFSG